MSGKQENKPKPTTFSGTVQRLWLDFINFDAGNPTRKNPEPNQDSLVTKAAKEIYLGAINYYAGMKNPPEDKFTATTKLWDKFTNQPEQEAAKPKNNPALYWRNLLIREYRICFGPVKGTHATTYDTQYDKIVLWQISPATTKISELFYSLRERGALNSIDGDAWNNRDELQINTKDPSFVTAIRGMQREFIDKILLQNVFFTEKHKTLVECVEPEILREDYRFNALSARVEQENRRIAERVTR